MTDQSPTPRDVMLVKFMVTSYIKHHIIFIQRLHHGRLRCGEWTSLDPSVYQHPRTSVYLSYNWLLFKMGRSYPSEESKDIHVINFIKHHVIYHFHVPRQMSMITDPQSSVKYSKYSVTNSKCILRLPTVLQNLLTRLMKNFSRSLSQGVNVTETRS